MASLVFLLDVDNTLLDNDRCIDELARDLKRLIGPDHTRRFWEIYETARQERGYVDYVETLQRFGLECADERAYADLCALVLGYPFQRYLYPGALAAIARLRRFGKTVILSDGDPVFQAAKIGRAGLARAVDGHVLITAHKEQQLGEVQRRFPTDRYVLVDDKPRILEAVKAMLGERVTTVFVRQGKCAQEAGAAPPADLVFERIGELRRPDWLSRR